MKELDWKSDLIKEGNLVWMWNTNYNYPSMVLVIKKHGIGNTLFEYEILQANGELLTVPGILLYKSILECKKSKNNARIF